MAIYLDTQITGRGQELSYKGELVFLVTPHGDGRHWDVRAEGRMREFAACQGQGWRPVWLGMEAAQWYALAITCEAVEWGLFREKASNGFKPSEAQKDALARSFGSAPLSERASIRTGMLVHVLHDNLGTDQLDAEMFMPAGSIAEVQEVRVDGEVARVELLYPNGVSGYWQGDELRDLAIVVDEGLRDEAKAALKVFASSDRPIPAAPQPLLAARIGAPRVWEG